MAGIPAALVHGRLDLVCRARNALRLHEALPGSRLRLVDGAGHSPFEPPMARALIEAARQHDIQYFDSPNGAMMEGRGGVAFNDLIVKTVNLLSRPDAGSWVQYKLDQGIDHILVDEAQDTSPVQWDVIRSLREDFFTGLSARPGVRTFFAVGDEKQSIYSFQGARPERLRH